MAFLVGLFLISYLSLVLGQDCTCGIGSASRIIGGTAVSNIAKYPWMAFVLVSQGGDKYNLCGGAIINDQYILTAAHCLETAQGVQIGVGSIYDYTQNQDLLPTAKFQQHENFDSTTLKYDIALIKLASPLTWSNKVRPICLPTTDMDESGELTIAGWGAMNREGELPHKLLETKVREYPFDDCNPYWGNLDQASQFCASLIDHDNCQGDSGGPLWKVINGKSYTLGIVSFGLGISQCGTARADAVYTKVSNYLDWIQSNTADGNYCSN